MSTHSECIRIDQNTSAVWFRTDKLTKFRFSKIRFNQNLNKYLGKNKINTKFFPRRRCRAENLSRRRRHRMVGGGTVWSMAAPYGRRRRLPQIHPDVSFVGMSYVVMHLHTNFKFMYRETQSVT